MARLELEVLERNGAINPEIGQNGYESYRMKSLWLFDWTLEIDLLVETLWMFRIGRAKS